MLYRTTAIALTTALALAAVGTPAAARPWHRGWGGAAAGFATGAIIGGALASRPYYGYSYGYAPYAYGPTVVHEDAYAAAPDRDDAYCSQRYRSYDPRSGTYLGYDGIRHPCP